MTARAPKPVQPVDETLLDAGLALQEQGLQLLLAEIRALQAMIPAGERELPTDTEVEAGFDNMPV